MEPVVFGAAVAAWLAVFAYLCWLVWQIRNARKAQEFADALREGTTHHSSVFDGEWADSDTWGVKPTPPP